MIWLHSTDINSTDKSNIYTIGYVIHLFIYVCCWWLFLVISVVIHNLVLSLCNSLISLLLVLCAVLILKVVVVGGGVLVLLVLADQVVHVALGLGELHLVHSLSSVPVQEGLAAEHRRELLGDALKHVLNGRGVPDEGRRHLESFGRDVADRRFDVIRDPLHKVAAVLILDAEHLLV